MTRRETFAHAYRWFVARYAVADPRTLGLARIVVGLLLCANTARHWSVARLYYSNAGVLSSAELLAHPSSDFNFSIFTAFSTPAEVNVAFACALACHVCFTVGWNTRVFAALACLWVTSLDNRLVLVENGGYVVVNLLVLWLAFLPTGARFSIDAWRRGSRENRPSGITELDQRHRPEWFTAPHRSLASLVIVLNLAVIYIFNVANKYGETWRTGATIQYVLHLDRMVTGLAVFLREHMPYRLMQGAAWLTLLVEALIAVAIVWPTHRRLARPLAIVLIVGLHATFGVLMRLGPFSWFIIAWSLLLLQRTHWDAVESFHRRRFGGVTVTLAVARPFALRLGRVLARLDCTDSLTFEEGPSTGPLLEAVYQGQRVTGAAAYRVVWRALPLGFVVAPLANVVCLGMASSILRCVERNRVSIERFFGWDRPEPDLARDGLACASAIARSLVWPREGALAFLLLCSTSAVLHDNKSIPAALKHKQPKLVRATLGYLRVSQGWGMFAPNPVREDGVLAVDGYTLDGRRVDPFTGREPDLYLSDARGLGLGQIEQDYFNRIRLDRNRVYRKALSEYLQTWHRATGRPEDELVAFNVFWLRDRCPEPFAVTPTEHEQVCLLSWRRANFRAKTGMPALPPPCKEASAEQKD